MEMATGDKLVKLDGLKAVYDKLNGETENLKTAVKYMARFGLTYGTLPSSSFAQGRYNTSGNTTGASGTTNIRTKNYIPVGIKSVSVASGYTMTIHMWDTSNNTDTYEGFIEKNSSWSLTDETDISGYPASYRFKLVLNAPTGGEVLAGTDYDKLLFGFATDKTLSIEGVPADAKAVGDALNSINTELARLRDSNG